MPRNARRWVCGSRLVWCVRWWFSVVGGLGRGLRSERAGAVNRVSKRLSPRAKGHRAREIPILPNLGVGLWRGSRSAVVARPRFSAYALLCGLSARRGQRGRRGRPKKSAAIFCQASSAKNCTPRSRPFGRPLRGRGIRAFLTASGGRCPLFNERDDAAHDQPANLRGLRLRLRLFPRFALQSFPARGTNPGHGTARRQDAGRRGGSIGSLGSEGSSAAELKLGSVGHIPNCGIFGL